MSATKIQIEFVNTDEALQILAQSLLSNKYFAFDTEFDRFWREYGFNLLLIQIFDGEKCYLIDPLAITNFKPLWNVFENKNICKVAYACSEDIQLLKINNCFVKNIYDVQIAAKLCNHNGNSFGDLVADICKTTINKTLQRSNWRTRPLSNEQQVYASNDVIWLPLLKKHFDEIISKNGLNDILQIENSDCENLPIANYEVKLSAKQNAKYSNYYKQILLQILMLRDKAAQNFNVPPFMIFTDETIENIIENPKLFLNSSFEKGFSSKFKNNEKYSKQFLEIIKGIDVNEPFEALKKERPTLFEKKTNHNPTKDEIDMKCKKIHQEITKKHGIVAGEFIMRGLKKALQARHYKEMSLKPYQLKMIQEACIRIGIEL